MNQHLFLMHIKVKYVRIAAERKEDNWRNNAAEGPVSLGNRFALPLPPTSLEVNSQKHIIQTLVIQ